MTDIKIVATIAFIFGLFTLGIIALFTKILIVMVGKELAITEAYKESLMQMAGVCQAIVVAVCDGEFTDGGKKEDSGEGK